MNLQLFREPASVYAMKGELFADGVFFCFALERSPSDDVQPIPAGAYEIEVFHSPHFGKDVPRLVNVPGRSSIEIHGGNTAADSKGCILLGYNELGADSIGDAKAVDDLVARIKEDFVHGSVSTIAVLDP